MLYRISGSSTFLLGSCHLLPDTFTALPAPWERAWAASTQLFIECRFDRLNSPAYEEYSNGRSLSDDLDDALYAQVRSAWLQLERDVTALPRVKPWTAALVIGSVLHEQAGLRRDFGIDWRFLQDALKTNRPVHELETVCTVFDCFRLLPVAEQRRFLDYLTADLDRARRDLTRVIDAWSVGDVPSLAEFLQERFRICEPLFDALITARNRAWLASIAAAVRSGVPTMIVVGALHLVGRGSVIEYLKQEHDYDALPA